MLNRLFKRNRHEAQALDLYEAIVAQARRLDAAAVPGGLPPGLHVVDGRIVAICGDGGALRGLQLLQGSSADRADPVSAPEFQNITAQH